MEGERHEEEISSTSQGIQEKKRKASNAENSNVSNGMEFGRNLHALALSYYPVLRNVFRMMDEEDLEKARKVCTYWRDVAHLIMSIDYEIHLGPPYFDSERYNARRHDWVLVKKRDRHNPQSFTEHETNSSDLLLLNEDLQRRQVSISLNIDEEVHIQGPRLKKFFSKFGNLVVELDYFCHAYLPLSHFCKVLLQDLPNLQNLNFSPRFHDENVSTDPELRKLNQSTHKNLKKITLGKHTSCSFHSLAKILQLTPNLEEIHNLPIWLINAAVIEEKGPALKSLKYNYSNNISVVLAQNELTIMSAFEKLAQLKPKLTTFGVLPNESSFDDRTKMEIKPLVVSILQSSADTLRSFEMRISDWSFFQNCVPQLNEVKTVAFHSPSSYFEEGRSSLPQIALQKMFPNANEMQIWFDLNENSMTRYLPKNVLSPWGSQIKSLRVGRLPPSSVPFLRGIFPKIQHLQFSGTSKRIAEVLPALAEYWGAQLKSMTILVESGYDRTDENLGILDCAFTGLSRRDVAKLLYPWFGEFTHAEIQNLKKRSSLRQLTELKQLTIKLGNHRCGLTNEHTAFTHVSNDFAFKLLPNLKVTVGIWKNCNTWKVFEMPSGDN